MRICCSPIPDKDTPVEIIEIYVECTVGIYIVTVYILQHGNL